MYFRSRLRRLERETESRYETLLLPDGTEVRYRSGSAHEPGDLYEAFVVALQGGEHWLLPYVRQMDTTTGFPGLIRALEGSRARGD